MAKWTNYFKFVEPKADAVKVSDNQTIGDQGAYGNFSWYQRLVQGSASRLTRYREYDLMDNDVIVSKALDTMAEEITGNVDKTSDCLELYIDDEFKDEVDDNIIMTLKISLKYWSKIYDLKNRLFKIARTTMKYGDCYFERVKIKETNQIRWVYVHPKNVIGAIVDEVDVSKVLGWQIKADAKKVKSSYGVPVSDNSSNIETKLVTASEILRFTLNDDMSDAAPFGDSVLGPVYRAHKQKELIEDAIIIYRIQRAPERRVFYIDVGKMPQHRVKTYLEGIKNEIKQKKVPNIHGGQSNVDTVYNPQSMNEDFFFAQRCISLKTKIPLLDGRILTLKEIINEYKDGKINYTYSIDTKTQKMIPGEIEWAGVTRKNAKVLKITLDNGKELICTPDHKLIDRSGNKIEAQDIEINESLMPLYRKFVKTNKNQSKKNYEMILDNKTGKWKFTHLEILPKNDTSNVIHHKDYNPKNNSPINLEEMDKNTHWEIHSKNGHALGELWKNNREKMLAGIHKYHKNRTEEQTQIISERNRKNGSKTWEYHKENMLELLKKSRSDFRKSFNTKEEYNEFMSSLSKSYWDNISEEDYKHRQIAQINYNKKRKSYNINDDIFSMFMDYVKKGNNSLPKIKTTLTNSIEFKKLFQENNLHLDRIVDNFGDKFIYKLCKFGGYENFQSLKEEFKTNHKVISIEYLEEREDTGCLTIKDPGKNHNFAIESGIYITNSEGRGSKVETLPAGQNLGELADLEYFQNKVWEGLKIPISYMREGGDHSSWNDGKVGVAYIKELRFALYIQRLQGYLEHVLDVEFKRYLRAKNINIDESIYNIILPEPSNFGKFRQQEVDAALLGMYPGADAIPYLSKRYILSRYLQMTEDEIITNERLLREEKDIPKETSKEAIVPLIYNTPGESAETGLGGDLGAGGNLRMTAGLAPEGGDLGGKTELPGEEAPTDIEQTTPPAGSAAPLP